MYGGVNLEVWRSVNQDGVRYVCDTIMLTLKISVWLGIDMAKSLVPH